MPCETWRCHRSQPHGTMIAWDGLLLLRGRGCLIHNRFSKGYTSTSEKGYSIFVRRSRMLETDDCPSFINYLPTYVYLVMWLWLKGIFMNVLIKPDIDPFSLCDTSLWVVCRSHTCVSKNGSYIWGGRIPYSARISMHASKKVANWNWAGFVRDRGALLAWYDFMIGRAATILGSQAPPLAAEMQPPGRRKRCIPSCTSPTPLRVSFQSRHFRIGGPLTKLEGCLVTAPHGCKPAWALYCTVATDSVASNRPGR